MQTGLTQKPAADATGGSRANALTLHVMSARTPVLAGIIARAAHTQELDTERRLRMDLPSDCMGHCARIAESSVP